MEFLWACKLAGMGVSTDHVSERWRIKECPFENFDLFRWKGYCCAVGALGTAAVQRSERREKN